MKKETAFFLVVTFICAGLAVNGLWNGLRFVSDSSGYNATIDSPLEIFPPITVSPKEVRAVYLTAGVASNSAWTNRIIQLIKSTRLNSVVIDVKDFEGTYLTDGMKRIVAKFRREGIYPIARVEVFQDNALIKTRPDLALRNASGTLWSSGNGKYFWVDPASKEVWDKIAATAERALDMGFHEVNFDYVRFPSDGDMNNVVFPVYDNKQPYEKVIGDFFKYMTEKVREARPNAVLSVDLFAYSFLRNNGLGIGQKVGVAVPYFDVISPMIYPSHYAPGNFDFPNPAEEPYQVVFQTLQNGKLFLAKASSTAIIRPWIQDFDMGAIYDKQMVNEEMRAIKDAGYGDTWMVWNPTNIYDSEKFLKEN
ncbi:hypothetical protein D4R51_04110 [bacterium]|nr:MAG: hypothetical protein D4R51_04110 [bacterium]